MPDFNADLTACESDVWKTCVRILGDEEEARECFQQTYLDALQIEPRTVRSWPALLSRIATRRAMDLLRRKYRDRQVMPTLAVEPQQQDPPDANLRYQELRGGIRRALAGLPARQAEAFWLRHIEDWTPEEIGRELEIEPGNVRVLVHRAIGHLRRTLRPESVELLTQPDDK